MSMVLTGGLAAAHQQAVAAGNPNVLSAQKLPLLPPSATTMFPLNNMAALQHQAAAAGIAGPDPMHHLNPALLMSNMYLVPPPQAAVSHPHLQQTTNFDQLQLLAAASQQPGLIMLPPQHQRLFAAGPPSNLTGFPPPGAVNQQPFLLHPPPQFRAGLQLPFPPPAVTMSQQQVTSKRTHDQAFHSPTELLPTKRPPVVYTSSGDVTGAMAQCISTPAVLALPQIQPNFT